MRNPKSLPFFILFSSASTLLCCALPALLVALGLGSVFAALISQFPALIWLSENKVALFAISGLLLTFGGWMQWRARFASCPTDPELRRSCEQARKWSLGIYLFSVLIYFVGFFFAYVIQFL